MAAYCRLCRDVNKQSDHEDVFVTCNNCGSLACPRHYTFWHTSKNAFCTTCFPSQARQAIVLVADLTKVLRDLDGDHSLKTLREQIETADNLRDAIRGHEDGTVLTAINKLMTELASSLEEFEKKGGSR